MKWYSIKTQKIFKDGDFVPTHEADFLIELEPVVYDVDMVNSNIDNMNR